MAYTVEILRRAEKTLRGLTNRKLYHRLREDIRTSTTDQRRCRKMHLPAANCKLNTANRG
jgi:hypothetical protein